MSNLMHDRRESVESAMRDIREGKISMSDIQAEGMRHILAKCWLDGSISALQGQLENHEKRFSDG